MDLLIKSASLVHFGSEVTNQKNDILIEQGRIAKIAPSIKASPAIPVFEADNLHVSIGWFDMQVNFNDPGLEHKEDLESGCKAAAFGGFTGVACLSSSHTPTQSKSEIEYIKNKTQKNIVDVYPIGALSQNMEGKTMTEMYDMFKAGAVAFSDNKKPLADSGLLSRSLLYAKGFDGTILHFPEDVQLANGGKINEGSMSTQLGLKGIPALAEELMVARDISLAEYNSSPLHLSSISTAKSVDLIRAAKRKGIAITCGVAVHNLVLNENALSDFDSNYKVKPPLRSQEDVNALWDGLLDNTIDVICSDHTPQDIESKEQEFDTAAFGMISLETTYALLQSTNTKLSLSQLISKLTINPRKIVKLSIPELKEGVDANLTLFSPSQKWTLGLREIKSKSRNTPFIGKSFTGKVLAIVNKNQLLKH
jgi:dihydroorotase